MQEGHESEQERLFGEQLGNDSEQERMCHLQLSQDRKRGESGERVGEQLDKVCKKERLNKELPKKETKQERARELIQRARETGLRAGEAGQRAGEADSEQERLTASRRG